MSNTPKVKFVSRPNDGLLAPAMGKTGAAKHSKLSGSGKEYVPQEPTEMLPRQKSPPPPGNAAKPQSPPLTPVLRRQTAHKTAKAETGIHASAQAHAYSRNWAGAIVPAVGGRRFTAIIGSWKVPKVAKTGSDWGLVSIWIGLGGSRPASHSMPQIGSEHGWDGEKEIHRLWCQWWLGDNSAGYLSHVFEPSLKLEPGVEITCSLSVDASGKTVEFDWSCSNARYGTIGKSVRPVIADSANWIVERPTEVWENPDPAKPLRLGKHYRLPQFPGLKSGQTLVKMEGCHAQLGPALGGAANAVRFVDRRPSDGRLVSLRSIIPGAGRSFVELEPSVAINPRDDELRIVRHQP